ncbi:MAG: methionyl-tRNA formyltransferase [Clostridia bacterium]|nr:methionyl-tRNA formyltransferase [Clostridia bacterium]
MRVVYMGTPDFAVKPLLALLADGQEVVGVFTREDKPVGRKAVLTAPPVKVCAQEHGLTVFQPATLKNGAGLALLEPLKPDLVVVAAYGRILPPEVLQCPKYGCINLHGSLLPKYRGAAPIQRAVMNGEPVTGITVMQMNEGLDTGDMLLKKEVAVGCDETAGELFDRLTEVAAALIPETMCAIEAGTFRPEKQNEEESTYAAMLTKADSRLDWQKSAFEVHNHIRGLDPWPTATTTLDGKTLKLFRSSLQGDAFGAPGAARMTENGLEVSCADGAVLVREVQADGKRRMSAADFFRGHPLTDGTVLE